jgi:two-component system chemotaxis response regulator CheY
MVKKILIVDDASYMREMIKDILTKGGYEIAGEAENTPDAISKYPSLKPDLVTMDIVMKDKTGIDGVKEIMKTDPNAKILMVSAMGQQAMVVEAIQAGAKGFVIKPFKPEVLLEEVKRIVGK